jgi:hypothetical protein
MGAALHTETSNIAKELDSVVLHRYMADEMLKTFSLKVYIMFLRGLTDVANR